MSLETIKELKERIGGAAEFIIANGLGLEQRGKMYRCPDGFNHKNGDKNPSMGWDAEHLRFNCLTCGYEMDIYKFFTEHQGYSHIETIEKMGGGQKPKEETFNEGVKNLKGASKEGKQFLMNRGLTEQTIKDMKICSYNEYGRNKLAYVYFNNDIKPDAVKLRSLDPNTPKKYRFTSITGSNFHFYNKHNVLSDTELIITEGECDCAIVWQCGYRNVVSVGCGALAVNKMIEQESKFISKFSNIIILSDNDEAGERMDEAFITKYPEKIKTIDKTLYQGCNDANELYLKHGEKAIKDLVESAIEKIEGEYNPDDETYENILKVNTGKFIPTGMPTIDNALNELRPGYVTLITGRSNDGKSTFTTQIVANAIECDSKVYWVSGEEVKEDLMENFRKLLIGKNPKHYVIVKENRDDIKKPTRQAFEAISKWHKGKLKIFVKGESKLKTADMLLDMIEKRVKIERFNLVVIDNLMSVLSAKAAEKFVAQSDFMQRLHDIASINKCHIILVLHPNKELRKGKDMEFEEISGASELSQKADNVIFVRKAHDPDLEAKGISGYVTILKNRKKPFTLKTETQFDFDTGFINEFNSATGNIVQYQFSWLKYYQEEATLHKISQRT